ncbi:MAG: tetratricopeptide repeat protein [Xanthomonadales bacterium]|nr:tetratricopeptide repeat protein [Xanthomonadales bacterium]
MSLFQELRRRNVFKVGIAYAVTTWVLLQLTDVVAEIMELPVWAPKLILLLLAVGFVPALIIAWAFELTPEGIKLESQVDRGTSVTRRTGRKLDYAIMILLGLSLAYFIWESRYKDELAQVAAPTNAPAPAPTADGADAELPEPARDDAPASARERRNAIAVLPFANRSDQASDQYFTDGIHDDLLTQLSRIGAFSVISRTSVMEYRDTPKNLREIADELDVAHVMEGAVQRAGDRVRINVQLIDAETDEHLWAEIYDRELTTENLFDIQSEIAVAIAGALEATLTEQELADVGDAPTDNVAAYDLYLQARQFTLEESKLGNQQALAMYEEALRLDPDFVLALVGMADAHITTYWHYGGDPKERDRARAVIDRARAMDPDLPELSVIEGAYWYWGHLDYERALYHLDRALDKAPGNPRAWMLRGWASRRDGQWEQAVESMEQALTLDPRVTFNWVELAQTLAYLHRYEAAKRALQKARGLDPASFWVKTLTADLSLNDRGDVAAALRATTGIQHSGEPISILQFVEPRLMAGRFDEALEAVDNMPEALEFNRARIQLREELQALIHFLAGREEAARSSADAAWFRLQNLRQTLGEDYRILHAEAVVAALRGEAPDVLRERVQRAVDARPVDAVESILQDWELSRVFGLAGMAEDATRWLSSRLAAPSYVTARRVALDPAYDAVRDDLAFAAMLERHQSGDRGP